MARQKENNIRDELIANILDDLAAEIYPANEPRLEKLEKNEEEDKTNLVEEMLFSPLKSSVDLQGTDVSEKSGDSSTQVATQILSTLHNHNSVLPEDPDKTELARRMPEVTKAVTQMTQKNQQQLKDAGSKIQAIHYLKIAQEKIAELEKEIDRLREENELLVIAAQTSKKQASDLSERLSQYEKERVEALERVQLEINIYRENLASKEKERKMLEDRVRQLESSIAKEIKKVRNRERELENRLELSKQEKIALLRAKDDTILELRRRIDDLNMEIETHRVQYAELKNKADFQHGQLSRTVKALRLALAHLESEGENQTVPLKKAE